MTLFQVIKKYSAIIDKLLSLPQTLKLTCLDLMLKATCVGSGAKAFLVKLSSY